VITNQRNKWGIECRDLESSKRVKVEQTDHPNIREAGNAVSALRHAGSSFGLVNVSVFEPVAKFIVGQRSLRSPELVPRTATDAQSPCDVIEDETANDMDLASRFTR
jgi:hypothetical protein